MNSPIKSFLCQIAKNLWYDELKKSKRYEDIDNEDLVLAAKEDLEEEAIQSDFKLNLFRKIRNLDAQTKEVMYLRLTGELSFKEIGRILEKSENWARVTFYRGKQKLKEVD